MKTKIFKSFEEYETWTSQFEECCDYENIPVAIDDGWKVSVDMFTECKSYKTALRRFAKAFITINSAIAGWIECMKESCENGCFEDVTGWRPAWTSNPKEIEEFSKHGTFSWGVEETADGLWYVFLNISGGYAGREARA